MEKNFNLESEVKCDYLISHEMKKVWNIELEMLKKLDKICKDNNIKYSLAGGSLLGAVRHKGYIPWDDDIDIMMQRNEYEKFLEIAQKQFEFPYFIQYYKTEKYYNRGHAQIRNSNTTAIINGDEYNDFNKGIFIDIFPLDNIPDSEDEKKKFLKKILKHKKKLEFFYNIRSSSKIKYYVKKIIRKIKYTFIDYNKEIEKFENLLKKYNNIETKQCGALGFRPDEFKYETQWFKEIIEVPFENMKVKIIRNYDEALKRQYNDYMKIPKDKNGSIHGKVIFNTNESYKRYVYNTNEGKNK